MIHVYTWTCPSCGDEKREEADFPVKKISFYCMCGCVGDDIFDGDDEEE